MAGFTNLKKFKCFRCIYKNYFIAIINYRNGRAVAVILHWGIYCGFFKIVSSQGVFCLWSRQKIFFLAR